MLDSVSPTEIVGVLKKVDEEEREKMPKAEEKKPLDGAAGDPARQMPALGVAERGAPIRLHRRDDLRGAGGGRVVVEVDEALGNPHRWHIRHAWSPISSPAKTSFRERFAALFGFAACFLAAGVRTALFPP